VLQIFAHPDLSHQLVLVTIHPGQLADMGEDVLETVGKLKNMSHKTVQFENDQA